MIKKLFPGDYYAHSLEDVSKPEDGEHMEHGSSFHDCRRMLAWMFYLNDIKKEGGTRWPQQNFTSRPRAGDLYIWPAGWTHSHHGLPAPKETKYLMSGWCSLDNGVPWVGRRRVDGGSPVTAFGRPLSVVGR